MKISDIPENYRSLISTSYIILAVLALGLYPFGAEERYASIIFYCIPLFAVSWLLKCCLMKDLVESRVVFALFSAFSVIQLPIEVGLRSLLVSDNNGNNKVRQLLTDIGLVSNVDPEGIPESGISTSLANFVLILLILMDVAFLILQLYLLVTYECIEELADYRTTQVQIVRQPIAQVGSSRRDVEDVSAILENGEFSPEFVERMKCPICVDRIKQKRCQGCKQGMCAVCVAQIEESQVEPNCPMCRKPLITEDLVLCRL